MVKKSLKKACDDMKYAPACCRLGLLYRFWGNNFMEEEFLKKCCDNAKGAKLKEYYNKEDFELCYELVSFYESRNEMQKANEVIYRIGQMYEKKQEYSEAAKAYHKLCSFGVSQGCDAYERLKRENRIQ
jgi:hypothetical protein